MRNDFPGAGSPRHPRLNGQWPGLRGDFQRLGPLQILHSTLYTLQPTPYTLHPILQILHTPILQILHFTLYNLYSALYLLIL